MTNMKTKMSKSYFICLQEMGTINRGFEFDNPAVVPAQNSGSPDGKKTAQVKVYFKTVVIKVNFIDS